jgi:hypothetical protein
MKKLEYFLIIALIAWAFSIFLDSFRMYGLISLRIFEYDKIKALEIHYKFLNYLFGLFALLVDIAIGIWLYKEAKNKNQSKIIWPIFGLVFGLPALIFYYVYRIYDIQQDKLNKNNLNKVSRKKVTGNNL